MVFLHLGINYFAVRGLALRTLNRQRTSILWTDFRSTRHKLQSSSQILSPLEVSRREQIFSRPDTLRDGSSGAILGYCTIGSSISRELQSVELDSFHDVVEIFKEERYILWLNPRCLYLEPDTRRPSLAAGLLGGGPSLHLHIFLKVGHTSMDHARAWSHALEVASMLRSRHETESDSNSTKSRILSTIALMRTAHERMAEHFPTFMNGLKEAGWNVSDGSICLMAGSPTAVIEAAEAIALGEASRLEPKKDR
jgi:hypothetical protein